MSSFPICLIGGSGRSGTTILAKCLSQHPKMTDVPESRYLVDPDGILDFYSGADSWSPFLADIKIKRLDELLKAVTRDSVFSKSIACATYFLKNKRIKLRHKYYGINMQDSCPEFATLSKLMIDKLQSIKFSGEWIGMDLLQTKQLGFMSLDQRAHLSKLFREYLISVYGSILVQQNAEYYLEKNTWNHLFMPTLLEFLPEAKLVYIARDPRDVVASYIKQSWMPPLPEQSARVLKDLTIRWENIKKNIPDNTFIEITLEELVSFPEKTLRAVCDFYCIEWDSALLSLDLSHSNQGRWKKQFNSEEKVLVQDILQQQITKGEYV